MLPLQELLHHGSLEELVLDRLLLREEDPVLV